MLDFIARLQEKPEHQRRAIAFGFSLGCTLIVLAIWGSAAIISLGAGSGKLTVTQEDVAAQQKVVRAEASPLQSLKQSAAAIGSTFDQVRGFFGNFGKVQYENK